MDSHDYTTAEALILLGLAETLLINERNILQAQLVGTRFISAIPDRIDAITHWLRLYAPLKAAQQKGDVVP